MKGLLLLIGAALVAVGCSSDSNNLTGPDPAACVKGSISSGGSKSGELTTASCLRWDFAVNTDSVYYDSYALDVASGRGYLITVEPQQGDAGFDNTLEVVAINATTGAEQVLGASDDEGGDYNGQLRFIAPASARLAVRVSGYSRSDIGKYVLTVKSCDSPLPKITGALGPTTQTLSASDCVLRSPYASSDSTPVKLYQIHFDAQQERVITVTSTDFSPIAELWGPGFDGLCYLEGCGGEQASTTNGTLTIDYTAYADYNGGWLESMPGDYTLAVGASQHDAAGNFTISVGAPTLNTRRAAYSIFHTNNPTKLGLKQHASRITR
jgi:hypothetical protein